MHGMLNRTYKLKSTVIVQRSALENEGIKYFDLSPPLVKPRFKDLSWKVTLERCNDKEVSLTGLVLWPSARIQYWMKSKERREYLATLKVRVRQESDTAVDSVAEYEVPWTLHKCPGDYYFNDSSNRLKIIPSLRRMHIHFRVTWRGPAVKCGCLLGTTPNIIPGHEQTLLKKLQALHASEDGDVVFIVGGEEIRAHTAVLAIMSEVFRTMFQLDTEDRRTGRVQVEDASPKAFRAMLRSMYTWNEPAWDAYNVDDLLQLAYLAKKYVLELLLAQCARRMVIVLQVSNVCKILKAAYVLELESVVDRGIQCIQNNLKVLLSKEWRKLAQKNPKFISEMSSKINLYK